jgi:hypothetical protein
MKEYTDKIIAAVVLVVLAAGAISVNIGINHFEANRAIQIVKTQDSGVVRVADNWYNHQSSRVTAEITKQGKKVTNISSSEHKGESNVYIAFSK